MPTGKKMKDKKLKCMNCKHLKYYGGLLSLYVGYNCEYAEKDLVFLPYPNSPYPDIDNRREDIIFFNKGDGSLWCNLNHNCCWFEKKNKIWLAVKWIIFFTAIYFLYRYFHH